MGWSSGGIYVDSLFVVLEKIIRLMAGESYHAHTDPLFYRLKILKLNDIHVYFLAICGFKMNSGGLFSYPAHSYDTRCGQQPIPAFQRLSRSCHSLSTVVPRTWNTLPSHVKVCTTLSIFKGALREFLLDQYVVRG